MIGVLCCNCIGFGWNSKTVGKRRSRTYGFWSSPRKKIASMNGLMIILSHCQPFSERFPEASANAIDLLSKLLVFDASKRITVDVGLVEMINIK